MVSVQWTVGGAVLVSVCGIEGEAMIGECAMDNGRGSD